MVDATFSSDGSELTLAWEVVDEGAVRGAMAAAERDLDILAIAPQRDAFEGPFAGPMGQVRLRPDGTVTVALPPLDDVAEGDDVEITVSAVGVQTSAPRPTRIEGEWQLSVPATMGGAR